ncbi:MAG TPA: FecR domain-containing protein [Planctomycetaceae bacterium]|nr:FecR domain-containing protein [Planctomycetaceae bacterium]
MNAVRDLMQRFVEDRDQLSESELESLLSAVRGEPQLASELKEQLIIDELLAQRLDLTRWHFLPQIDQRIRDETQDVAPIRASELQARAAQQDKNPDRGKRAASARLSRQRGPRWGRRILALGLILLVAVAGVWMYVRRAGVAIVELAEGQVEITGKGPPVPAKQWGLLSPGDRLATGVGASAAVRYPDGTVVRLESETSLIVRSWTPRFPGKHLFVETGRIQASVSPQPAGRPMIFESATATAEVLGTALQFVVEAGQTALTVTEGRVRMRRNASEDVVTVGRDEFAVVTRKAISAAPLGWPGNRDGLIFLFETNDKPNLVRSIATGVNRSYSLRPRGTAHLDHNYAMVLSGGAFLAEDVDGDILAACRKTNELSIEADIRPSVAEQDGPARIVTFSTDTLNRDFTLGQQGDQLIIRIRTPQTGPNGVGGIENGLPICRLTNNAVNHVVVSYRPGRLVCYLNGRQVFEGNQIQGDFGDWSAQHLLFGDEYGGERNWSGTLEGVAIFNRFIEPEEAARNTLQYGHLRQSRAAVPQVRVKAELLERSSVPSVEAIQPHRSALVVCRYRVQEVLKGELSQSVVLVAQWTVLDGRPQAIATQPLGSQSDLLLEPLDRNPQLQRCLISDDFTLDTDHPRFVDVRR